MFTIENLKNRLINHSVALKYTFDENSTLSHIKLNQSLIKGDKSYEVQKLWRLQSKNSKRI